MSSVSTSAGGYPWRTCPQCNLQCKLRMNYNINLRRSDIHQNNQSQESQERTMVKPKPMVFQQQIIDTLRRMQPFLVFLCVANAFMFVLLLLKSV
ncbi:hypothetical protein AMTRI_Chr01g108430 [Amborella trichopoda]